MTPEEIRKECESYEKKEKIRDLVAIGLVCIACILAGIDGYQKGEINLFFLIFHTFGWIFFFFSCCILKNE